MTETPQNKSDNSSLKTPKVSFREIIRSYGLKRAAVFPIVALVFIAIILTYHFLLYNYTKTSILEEGRLNAGQISQEVELYMSSGTDTLKRCAYSMEKMLADGRGHDEAGDKGPGGTHDKVLQYLTEETDVIQHSILPESTGVYACVHEEYHDGSGWDPGPDYVPMERPWYTEAVDDPGKIVLVNPYLDLYSGDIVMTLSKCLEDGKSVVALDITLGRIQEIIESHTPKYESTINMVVAGNGVVVANTISSERGKDYNDENGTLGHAILSELSTADSGGNFDFAFQNGSYTACAVPLSNGWYCISVTDSEIVYRPINLMMLLSIAASILTLAVFLMIMFYSGRREAASKHMQSLLISSADIYMSLCDLDVIDNSVTEIKNVNPAIAKACASVNHNMKEVFLSIMQGLPDSPTKQAAIDFTDLRTIDDRMIDTDTATIEYLSYGNIWVRARLIVSERTKDGKVSHVLWMLENITKEREERESLIDMSERAVAASEAKSAFLSNMSHEIRTPINAVLGMNEMILRECDDDNIVTYSNNIKSAGNSLLSLINDILDFSKIESGKMEIIPVDYDFVSLLNDLVNMIKMRVEAKGLELILDIDPEIPRSLYGDEVRVKQIITNILTNAAKYTDQGSVTLKISYDKRLKVNDCLILMVSVKDTGIGIKKEDLPKLFGEFERVDEKRNRNIEGTGLGMSITKNLLSMMGSSLNVESEYGKGSEFSFKIVQTVRKWDPIGDYKAAMLLFSSEKNKYVPKFTASLAHILVVDDTYVNLVVFKGLLTRTEVQIDTADNGRRAIEMASEKKYDIIFLDHMMPDKDGIETLHDIRSKAGSPNRDTPAVCLTANALSGAKEFYMEAGFNDYLTKPIDSQQLEEMIYNFLPKELIETVDNP